MLMFFDLLFCKLIPLNRILLNISCPIRSLKFPLARFSVPLKFLYVKRIALLQCNSFSLGCWCVIKPENKPWKACGRLWILTPINLQSFFLKKMSGFHYVKSVQILIFSGTYFPVFSPNTGKYRPKKTPYLETFHTVIWEMKYVAFWEETKWLH